VQGAGCVPIRLGLIVNPVAGLGGPAGLKGSDGADVQRLALERGASARAGERATAALAVVAAAHPGVEVLTASGALGEHAVRAAGLVPRIVSWPVSTEGGTTAADTQAAARAIAASGAELILFVGGDGTARDVVAGLEATGGAAGVAALGVPAGVKMYSACFAVSPSAAGALAAAWLGEEAVPVRESEVLDVVEEQLRHGRVDPRLFGYLRVPFRVGHTQARKTASPSSEAAAAASAVRGVIAQLRPGVRYLLGPGSTVAELGRQLGLATTPLGVDVLLDGELVLTDATEQQLLAEISGRQAQAVITIIGGQGFLLGRGNQQISARVVRELDPVRPLIVVAPEQKLIELGGRPLLVDTGDAGVDESLAGFARITTGVSGTSMYPVSAPESTLALNHTITKPTPQGAVMRLENKKAIVTGGAGGIGRATALAFAAEGAQVAVVDLREDAALAVVEEIRAAGGTAVAIAADVSNEDDIQRIIATTVAELGGVNVVFNNAGIIRRTTAVETTAEEWDRVFGVNVKSIFLMCKHVVPIMAENGGGSIVNTGSGWGLKGGGQAISYCASKGAVVNMTRALAIDHGPQGIRVNSVNPGDVNTGMLLEEARQLSQDANAFLAESADRPLGRMGQPSEIAAAVVWLASDDSSYVTGSALVVDGGGIA
jgi:predicted polyphosphate/ATP-dependent NAD kinase/NAD(P)-dependent dehydrogenase (short-subunit alcohol dehydrogenase family)